MIRTTLYKSRSNNNYYNNKFFLYSLFVLANILISSEIIRATKLSADNSLSLASTAVIGGDSSNGAGNRLTINNLNANIQQQQQQQPHHKSGAGGVKSSSISTNNSRKQHASVNQENEKLKNNDVLINAFKLKLLQLLEVDQVPSVDAVNISNSQIPEPIMREYNKLLRQQQNAGNHHHANSYSSSSSRFSRDKPFENDGGEAAANEQDDDGENEGATLIENDDQIRFNGSVVQKMMLLPKRIKLSEKRWCRDVDHHHHHHQQQQQQQAIINNDLTAAAVFCFKFQLEHKQFSSFELNSAKMFIKFDLRKLDELFMPTLGEELEKLLLKSTQIKNKLNLFKPYLYLQVNGHLIKKINLLKLIVKYRESQLLTKAVSMLDEMLSSVDDDNDENEVNEETTTSSSSSSSAQTATTSHFEQVDIKEQIKMLIANKKLDKTGQSYIVNVKLSLSKDLLNFTTTRSIEQAEESLFGKLDDHVALDVKFADNKLHHSSISNDDDEQKSAASRRQRRQTNGAGRRPPKTTNEHHQQQQQQHNYNRNLRDCSELRRLGFTSSNYSCCREVISFSLEQLGWSHWILSPKVIEYKYCRGGCLSGLLPRFDNTQIVYKMFELSQTFESVHCCNIYDYEDDIPFIYGSHPNYQTKMVSLNAKTCLCS